MQVTDSLPAENRAKQLKQKPWVIFSFYHNFFMITTTLCPNGTVPGIKMVWVKCSSWGDQLYWTADTASKVEPGNRNPCSLFCTAKPQETFWKGRELHYLRLPNCNQVTEIKP